MADNTLQSNFQSNQNFDPDVKKMFKHFVTGGNTPDDNEVQQNVGIDDLRGQISVSVTNQNTKNLIASLNINPTTNNIAGTPNTTAPVQLVQESRCHTFYRIIGFPIINSDQSDFYNPGLDIIKGADITRNVTLDRKLKIASNVGSDFELISQAREEYASQAAQVFSAPESVEAGVLTLTSGTYGKNGNVNNRKFAQPFTINPDPFDFEIASQTYSTPGDITATYSLTGDHEVLLSDYQDPAADPTNDYKPNPGIGGYTILFNHKHIIKPFMVDPRIDFSIWASESKSSRGVSKRIAVPFVPNATYLKTSSTATAERPLLEKVIADRFSIPSADDAGTATSDLIDYIKSLKTIQSINIGSTPISGIFSGSIYKLSQQQALGQYVSTIQALMFKLVDSMRIVHARQGNYYWLPIPSNSGPEGGSSVRHVPFSQNIDASLLTINDFDIIAKQADVILSGLSSSIIPPSATPDPGNFAFSNYKLTFDVGTSDSQGNLSLQSQDSLTKKRERYLDQAGDALQIIEMIMGEFSGLGLADIVAIMGSLYVMPLDDAGTGNLLGFLDDDAITRAEVSLNQPSGSLKSKRSSVAAAMTTLANTVNGFYQIMDQIFQDYLNNNALNL